jgi:hypothetical protein
MRRVLRNVLAAIAATVIGACSSLPAPHVAPSAILGTRPSYLGETARTYPNQQAITPRIWIPGLEEGWIPQGLTIIGPHALVSSYQEADASRPKCRVFRVDLASGATSGSFDMPAPCVHAGGITDIGGGHVILADTRQDWRVDLEKALAAGTAVGATRGMIKLAVGFGSAFTFFDGRDLWNGVWVSEKNAEGSKIYRLPIAVFDRDGTTVDATVPLEVVRVPIRAQGGALDRDGNLWISASEGPEYSYLYRLDKRTGETLARFAMPSRIENIAFDREGRLWALSESGSRKYLRPGDPDFPFIFEIDVAKLR